MGKDINSPSLVAPKDLKTTHDLYVVKVNRQRAKEQMEANRKRAEADEAEFEELKGRYIGLAMTDGNIRLNTLNSVAEYYQEGERQRICEYTEQIAGIINANKSLIAERQTA